MKCIEKIEKKIKITKYLQTRSHRRQKYSSTYLKSLQKYKFQINDIIFVPDIHYTENQKIPKIYKCKIERVCNDEFTCNTQNNNGTAYYVKQLNKKPVDGYRFISYENEMYVSYSQAFERLKKLCKTHDVKINQDNWIDFPY